jgi:hypothetical protein
MVNLKTIASTVAVLCFAAASFASEEVKTKMHIELIDDNDHGAFRIELDSDEMGFNLHDMQVGENQSVVDKSGKSILVTREEDGFVFNVDGETIEMPIFDGEHHGAVWVGAEHDVDVKVHVMKDVNFTKAEGEVGTMIMSSKPIDEATQQAIKSLLESTGHGSEVNFINHERPHGDAEHQVRVLKKVIEKKD